MVGSDFGTGVASGMVTPAVRLAREGGEVAAEGSDRPGHRARRGARDHSGAGGIPAGMGGDGGEGAQLPGDAHDAAATEDESNARVIFSHVGHGRSPRT